MINRLWKLYCDDEAATAVEYAVLLALILMAVIGAIGTFGAETGGLWTGIDQNLDDTQFGQIGGS
jgi:Flp pilus assembly pilin Flp